jgi:hypothetical protein
MTYLNMFRDIYRVDIARVDDLHLLTFRDLRRFFEEWRPAVEKYSWEQYKRSWAANYASWWKREHKKNEEPPAAVLRAAFDRRHAQSSRALGIKELFSIF